MDISELSNHCDINKIKDLYGITEDETKVSTLEQSIITRLIAKDYL